MMSTTISSDDDLTIDLLAPCGEDCCTHKAISSSELLQGFPENLPELGKQVLLRVHGSTVTGLLLRRCGNEN